MLPNALCYCTCMRPYCEHYYNKDYFYNYSYWFFSIIIVVLIQLIFGVPSKDFIATYVYEHKAVFAFFWRFLYVHACVGLSLHLLLLARYNTLANISIQKV